MKWPVQLSRSLGWSLKLMMVLMGSMRLLPSPTGFATCHRIPISINGTGLTIMNASANVRAIEKSQSAASCRIKFLSMEQTRDTTIMMIVVVLVMTICCKCPSHTTNTGNRHRQQERGGNIRTKTRRAAAATAAVTTKTTSDPQEKKISQQQQL